MPSSDHREKAVEAAALYLRGVAELPGPRKPEEAEPTAYALLAQIDPHLRRAHFEEFREAMLSVATGKDEWAKDPEASWNPAERTVLGREAQAIRSALDAAQELLEGDHG